MSVFVVAVPWFSRGRARRRGQRPSVHYQGRPCITIDSTSQLSTVQVASTLGASSDVEAAVAQSEPVLVGQRRVAFLLLTALLLVAVGAFARYWFALPDMRVHPVLYAAATAGVFYLIGVWMLPWLAL